jgi:Ca-activated chloride channel family protein
MKTLTAVVALLTILQQTPAQPRTQKLVLNVTDTTGKYIQNMTAADFVVEEDGVEQKITGFAQGSDIPISLGILVDKSTSMRLPVYVEGKARVPAALLAARGIGRAVVRLMKPQDEFILMTFDEQLQVKQNFTQDRKKVEDQLLKLNEVGGATHLYNSVIKALDKMKKAKYRRRALVVITDAYDTSGKELEDLREEIAEQEVQVFCFGLRAVYQDVPDPTAEPLFRFVLTVLSRDTGGLSMVVDLPELQTDQTVTGLIAFAQILTLDLRGQYTLSYATEKTGPLTSRFVRVRSPHPNLRIRIRRDAEDPIRPQK